MGSPARKDSETTVMSLQEAVQGLLGARTKGEVAYYREEIRKLRKAETVNPTRARKRRKKKAGLRV